MPYSFKPAGYNSLSPYFIVTGSSRWIQLLQDIFSAKLMRKYERQDGSLMHAELMIDDSVIMVSEATEKYPANQLMLHVYVPDVRAVFAKAVVAGCTIMEEPVTHGDDTDTRGSFTDYMGNWWSVATQLLDIGI